MPDTLSGQDRGWLDTVQFTTLPPSAPVITVPPTNQVMGVGGDASFAVVATGFPAPMFQWRFNDAPMPNETNAVLLIRNVSITNVGNYTVLVSNSLGSVTSRVATLLASRRSRFATSTPTNWKPPAQLLA